MKFFILIFSLLMPLQETFKQKQLHFIRVKDAYSEKENTVKNYFLSKNLNYQGYDLFLRAFKQERVLEVWIKEQGASQFHLLTQYPFCAVSGTLGPKRREGDGQIPEGFYYVNHFNPQSNYHLSLGISYPNQSDKILGDQSSPGSAIYIHGNCVTIGCIPLSDDKIKELYVMAVEARNHGQEDIPVHIFPTRLSEENLSTLNRSYQDNPSLIGFWKSLQPVFLDFENSRIIAPVKINGKGQYHL
jgi:murein L,D-transpeptidase YafK